MLDSRICVFSSSNIGVVSDLTVAWVPTGMKTGVSIVPWLVLSSPIRALDVFDFLMILNGFIDLVYLLFSYYGSKASMISSKRGRPFGVTVILSGLISNRDSFTSG